MKQPQSVIQKVQQELLRKGFKTKSMEARTWLLGMGKQLQTGFSPQKLLRDERATLILPTVCKMGILYFYFYDPKGAADMTYYDFFPLCIPFKRYTNGFLGLNLHYIPPKSRVILLDRLAQYASDKFMDHKTRLRLTYDLLQGTTTLAAFKPCLKRYLFTQFQSKVLPIPPSEWDVVAYLPAERFMGETKQNVWKESREIIQDAK